MVRCYLFQREYLCLLSGFAARFLLTVVICIFSLQAAGARATLQTASPAPSSKVVSSPTPPYPLAAVAVLVSGEVKVDVVINKDGVVTKAQATY